MTHIGLMWKEGKTYSMEMVRNWVLCSYINIRQNKL
jgi:hypothetical protein